MLSWRAKKQLSIVLILGGILIIIGGAAYFAWRPAPSCTDGRKNQNETETDCGGMCAPCAVKHAEPITSFWTKIVPIRAGAYDVAAEIENPNQRAASGAVRYVFTLFDDAGTIAERIGTTFLYPQERTIITEENIPASRVPHGVQFRITGVDWASGDQKPPALVVLRQQYRVQDDHGRRQSVVEAAIRNDSAFEFREVVLEITLFDGSENLIGANRVAIETFLPGTVREITATWPQELPGAIASVRVLPRANIFDSGVILKP